MKDITIKSCVCERKPKVFGWMVVCSMFMSAKHNGMKAASGSSMEEVVKNWNTEIDRMILAGQLDKNKTMKKYIKGEAQR